jgi:hypothetical protein
LDGGEYFLRLVGGGFLHWWVGVFLVLGCWVVELKEILIKFVGNLADLALFIYLFA